MGCVLFLVVHIFLQRCLFLTKSMDIMYTNQKCLSEVLLSAHSIAFHGEITIIFWLLLLSRAMLSDLNTQ